MVNRSYKYGKVARGDCYHKIDRMNPSFALCGVVILPEERKKSLPPNAKKNALRLCKKCKECTKKKG